MVEKFSVSVLRYGMAVTRTRTRAKSGPKPTGHARLNVRSIRFREDDRVKIDRFLAGRPFAPWAERLLLAAATRKN